MILFTIALALLFDFINGFHDAANSIATVVSTRVLKPNQAVLMAAILNFLAFLVFGLHVAETIGKGVLFPQSVTPNMVLAALLAAIIWDLLTWYLALPTSSSHALIGGLLGAGLGQVGSSSIQYANLIPLLISIVLSPLLAASIGFVLMQVMSAMAQFSTPKKVDQRFRKLQLISASLYSLGHGGNDAQKTMGLIALLLMSEKAQQGQTATWDLPFWIVLACHSAIGLGTLFGGWRIVKTLGMKLTRLQPISGFCAENAAALSLVIATRLGIPVSTTQTITGAIIGVGSRRRRSSIRWKVALGILWAWALTIPAACLLSFLIMKLLAD